MGHKIISEILLSFAHCKSMTIKYPKSLVVSTERRALWAVTSSRKALSGFPGTYLLSSPLLFLFSFSLPSSSLPPYPLCPTHTHREILFLMKKAVWSWYSPMQLHHLTSHRDALLRAQGPSWTVDVRRPGRDWKGRKQPVSSCTTKNSPSLPAMHTSFRASPCHLWSCHWAQKDRDPCEATSKHYKDEVNTD